MLGKASTGILAVTAVLCCLAVMVNGMDCDLDINNMTTAQLEHYNKIMKEAKCKVTIYNRAELAITIGECITNVTGKPATIPEDKLEDLTYYQTLNINKTEWESVQSCMHIRFGWEGKTWTVKDTQEFIKNNMTFDNDDTRDEFETRLINTCIPLQENKAEAKKCGEKAFHEICFNIPKPKESQE